MDNEFDGQNFHWYDGRIEIAMFRGHKHSIVEQAYVYAYQG